MNVRFVLTKKEQILTTTLDLIALNGIQSTPMSLIAKESGVATGTIYHHFKSKNDIINALYLSQKQFFVTIANEVLNKKASRKQQFGGIWKGIYLHYSGHPKTFHFFQQVNFSKAITEETKDAALGMYAPLVDFFSEGIEQGEFVDTDVMLLVEILHGNIMTFVSLVFDKKVSKDLLSDAIELSWKQTKIE